jgi:hypothetical protein
MVGILMSSAEQYRDRDDEPRDNQAGNEVFLFEHLSRSSVAVWHKASELGTAPTFATVNRKISLRIYRPIICRFGSIPPGQIGRTLTEI